MDASIAVSLGQLSRAVPDAHLQGSPGVRIRDIVHDSRRVAPGTLFLAVPSVGGDAQSGGSRHLRDAILRGAAAVVVQQGVDPPRDVPAVVVRDARAAMADLAAAFFRHPSRQLQIYAVTGTDGKTTTSYLLDQILSFAGHTTGLIGTVEIKIGDTRRANLDRMTTPESLDLQRLLRTMADAGVTHVAMEASSHALALDRLRGCTLAACAVTNISADHVEFHGSWDAYFAAKASLFTGVGRGRPAVLNAADRSYPALAAQIEAPIISYGVETEARLRATELDSQPAATAFRIALDGRSVRAVIPMPGRFNVSNALAAAGLATVAGLPLETVADGLSRASGPPGRMQRITAGQPFEVIVDYAHTPNAFESVLAALRATTGENGRLIAVFGATGNRDRAKRPVLARIARRYADYLFITNEDPFDERAEAIIDEVARGLPPEEDGTRFEREPERGEAIRKAVARARPGDTVVILGKGHEQSIVVDGRKEPWSDSVAAREAIDTLQ